MTVDEQLARLRDMGIVVHAGVTAAQLPSAGTLGGALMALAAEPSVEGWPEDGLADRVGKFDAECVDDASAYEHLIRFVTGVAGAHDRVADVVVSLDLDDEAGEISYVVDGTARTWDVEVQGDWVDSLALSYVINDVAPPGYGAVQFWEDQTVGFAFVASEKAAELQRLLD